MLALDSASALLLQANFADGEAECNKVNLHTKSPAI